MKNQKQIELTTAYNLLNQKSKQLIKAHIQNAAGWSEATFYNKMFINKKSALKIRR